MSILILNNHSKIMSTDQRFFLIPTFVTLAICAAEVGISFNSVLLPNIQDNFQVSEAIAQSSVSIGLFALGFFGIIYGAISDILGRKPMFLIAIGLFSLASLLCASANTLGTFLIAKFIQGAGSGASWIVGNATLKDIFHGKDYVNIMNKIHAIAGITPAIAPFIGASIAQHFSWRHAFYALAGFGFICWIGMALFQQETLKIKKRFSIQHIMNEYQQLWTNQSYLYFLFIKVACVSILFVDISQTPLILISHLNVPQSDYGYYLIPSFLTYIFASVVAAKFSEKSLSFLKMGLVLILTCATGLILVPLTAINSALIKCFLYLGFSMIFGNATALIIISAEAAAGSASAIMIGLEMLISALGIAIVAVFFKGTYLPFAFFASVMSCLSLVSLQRYQKHLQRSGTGSKPPFDQG